MRARWAGAMCGKAWLVPVPELSGMARASTANGKRQLKLTRQCRRSAAFFVADQANVAIALIRGLSQRTGRAWDARGDTVAGWALQGQIAVGFRAPVGCAALP